LVELSRNEIVGWDTVGVPEPEVLRFGQVSLRLELPALRVLICGGIEVVQAVLMAVRDRNWGTVPGLVSLLERDASAEGVRLRFSCTHDNGDVGFAWEGEVTATALDQRTSVISYSMRGRAIRAFLSNRVGFCVLHPLAAAGTPLSLRSPAGISTSAFPSDISPWQPFFDLVGMSYSFGDARVDISFEGELFETEDQRNWTDASFKTYCPPSSLPFPRRFEAGQELSQRVVIELTSGRQPSRRSPVRRAPVHVRLGKESSAKLPAIGLGAGGEDAPELGGVVGEALGRLAPAHLHTVVEPCLQAWEHGLRRAASAASEVGARLQCEVVVNEVDQLEPVARVLAEALGDQCAALAPVMLFDKSSSVTTPSLVATWQSVASRHHLPEKVFGGSRANFAEFNRNEPPYGLLAGVTFAINPQVHAFSNEEIVQTLQVHEAVARQAVAMAGGLSLHVGPVTLKPRFNAVATDGTGLTEPEVDPRQLSLWAACWTLGSVGALTRGGATSLTYFETSGPSEVMCRAVGLPQPSLKVYPVYEILRRLTRHVGASVVNAESSDDKSLAILALAGDGHLTVLVGNLCAKTTVLRIEEPHLSFRYELLDVVAAERMLQGEAVLLAQDDPCTGLVQLGPHEIAVLTASLKAP
jgi:hypothetical protein